MQFNSRLPSSLRKSTEASLTQTQQLLAQGQYERAEAVMRSALDAWRAASAPRSEEAPLIISLGKCYEGQKKYEDAYELYMQALNHLTGAAYDEVYTSFLYLNQRMGTFTKKEPLF